MAYKTLVADLTVPKAVGELTDLFGNVVGHQTVAQVYPVPGTILDDEDVSPAVQQAVEDGELEGRLEKVGDDEENAVGEPFPDYGELSVEQIQTLFSVLPSSSIRAIQEYEAEHGENRAGIVDFHIGRGEAFTDRLTGRAGAPHQDTEEKEIAGIVTREVSADEGDFRFGESLSDDGQPQVPFYSKEGDERGEREKLDEAEADTATKPARGRRGRRSSQATGADGAAKEKADDKDGSGSKSEDND